MIEQTLEYLECIEQTEQLWRVYTKQRLVEVYRYIARLRRFAGLRPGRVAEIVLVRANELRDRADAIMSSNSYVKSSGILTEPRLSQLSGLFGPSGNYGD